MRFICIFIFFFLMGCEKDLLSQIEQNTGQKPLDDQSQQVPSGQVLPSLLDTLLTPKVGIPTVVVGVGAIGGTTAYVLDALGKRHLDVAVQKEIQAQIKAGRVSTPPAETGNVSGVFFIENQSGQKQWVVKPMGLAPDGKHRTDTKELEKKVVPGQEVGNEVLMYALDQALGGHYGIPKTVLVKVRHADFNPKRKQTRETRATQMGFLANWAWRDQTELASAQAFLPGQSWHDAFIKELITANLDDEALVQAVNQKMKDEGIARTQYDRLNIKLLSGGTDGHYGNFLYDSTAKTFGLIDAGYDFLDPKEIIDQKWHELFFAKEPMSDVEYVFLRNIDVDAVMAQMKEQARKNAQVHRILEVDADRLNALRLRLELAKVVGEMKATQEEWYLILRKMDWKGETMYNNYYRNIFKSVVKSHGEEELDWAGIGDRFRDAVWWSKLETVQDFFHAYAREMPHASAWRQAAVASLQTLLVNPKFKEDPNTQIGVFLSRDTALHVLARLGLHELLPGFLEIDNINCKITDREGRTALQIAQLQEQSASDVDKPSYLQTIQILQNHAKCQ